MPKDVGVVKRAIVTPDKHAPIHDRAAINVVKRSIEIIKPDIYVDLGDLGEWNSVSYWKYKVKKKPPLEYILPEIDKDVKGVNELLDDIDESLDKANTKKKYICAGNHDEWCDLFVLQYPYLKQYGFKNACKFDERGYTYYENGKYLKIGKLYFYHGDAYGGKYPAATHLRELGCNIMFGHHHSLEHITKKQMEGPRAAWSLGCLKQMEPGKNKWLKNKKHDWAHAFAVVDYYKGGRFTVHVVQIIDGKASLWGELIDGNK